MMRHIASVVAGILVLIPTWVAAGTCDAVLSKTLQGTRTGTYFNQTNNSKIRNVPKDEEFDFEILTSVRNGGCPGTGGNKCLISGTKGQQAALITMKQAPAGSPSLTVNSGEIVHLGSWLLSGNATHEYNTITVNSGGTVYFWGGITSPKNSKGHVEYIVNTLTVNAGGTVYMPPGDLYIGQQLNMDGALHPMGNNIPWWWLTSFTTPTTRLYVNGNIRVQNPNSGLNPSGSSPTQHLVIFTNGQVDLLGGRVRGALIQDNRTGSPVNFNMANNARFDGVASIDYGFNISGGDFYLDTEARNADFSDGCGSVVAPVDLTLTAATNAALTCDVVAIELSVKQNGQLVTDYQGTISLSAAPAKGTWTTTGYSVAGTLTPGSGGSASYQFHVNDGGVVTLGYANPSAGSVVLTASDGSVQDSTQAIEFSPEGFRVHFKPSPNPIANSPFAMSVEALEASDDPAICVPNGDYVGNQGIDFDMSYGSINGQAPAKTALTVNGAILPEQGAGVLTKTLFFRSGFSDPVNGLTIKDVGPLTIYATEHSAQFPTHGPLTGSGAVTVIPAAVKILDVRSQRDGACDLKNPAGTALSGDGFTAADAPFTAMVAGLIANCTATANACEPQNATCLAPSFAESVQMSLLKDTPANGVLGHLSGELDRVASDFQHGYVLIDNLRYDEVGSISLQSSVSNFLNQANTHYQDQQRVGRFYPAYLQLADASAVASCIVGDFSYLGADQRLTYQVSAYGALNQPTINYDNASLNYAFAASLPVHYLYQGQQDLSARLTGLSEALVWRNGEAALAQDFTLSRASTVDGPFVAAELGLELMGGDQETFATADLNYDCGGFGCTATHVLSAPLAPLYYGRLLAENGYGPESQALQVPFAVQYWDGSQFALNSKDRCTTLNLNMMSFDPALTAGDAVAIGTGSATVSLTNNLTQYSRTVVVNDGRFWIRYSAPGQVGAATHFMGVGGLPVPSEPWPDWLKYDWDQNGVVDPSTSAIASFGSQRGSDRVVSRREL